AHGDLATGAYALAEVARRSASHRESVLRRARALLGAGYEAEARVVFAATVDAFADGGTLPRSSDDVRELVTFAGRIAVDDALAAGDVKKAEARAVRARLANDEVMGRAWLLGRVDDARASAEARLRAEPDHPGATLILLASGAGDARALRNVSVRPVSASTFVAFATWSRIAFDAADLHDLLRALPHAPASPGDPLLVRPQAALLADGVMDASDAVPEAVVEAALRRGELRATRVATILASADARHRLLWLALTDPSSKDVRDLARHLGPAVARDARVALADVALARADGRAVAGGTLARLVDSAVGDALVAGIATKLARDPAEKSRVKRALEGLAWTSWERRVVSE
ncbi:MAG: hypothetical protein U0169_19985, partial [Polyangiaceae bacterium]